VTSSGSARTAPVCSATGTPSLWSGRHDRSRGLAKWMGVTLGFGPVRRARLEANRQIRAPAFPLARTPYLFCPIGFDFNSPIPNLVALLDEYNRQTYPVSGVFAVNAGMDDYLDLVASHKDRLPELALDLNPYWMGFYSSRPEMKQRCKKAGQRPGDGGGVPGLGRRAERCPRAARQGENPLERTVVANHHDFITGTSRTESGKRSRGRGLWRPRTGSTVWSKGQPSSCHRPPLHTCCTATEMVHGERHPPRRV